MNMHTKFHSNQEHAEAARQWQDHLQLELEPYGLGQLPGPVAGQPALKYLRETGVLLKRQFLPTEHPSYKVQYRDLPADALIPFLKDLVKACKSEAFNPATVPPGQFRQITKLGPNGSKVIEFIGQESFVKQMGIPGRRAVIRNPTTHPGWFPKEVPSVWVTGR